MVYALIFLNYLVCAIAAAHRMAKTPVWPKTAHDYIPIAVQLGVMLSLAFGWYQDASYIFNVLVVELIIVALVFMVHIDTRGASSDTPRGRDIKFAGKVHTEAYFIALLSTTIHAALIMLYNY